MSYSGVEFVVDQGESGTFADMVFCYVSQDGLDVSGYTQEEIEEEIVLGEMGYELSDIASLVQSYNEHGIAALLTDPQRLSSFLENADSKTIKELYGPEWGDDIADAIFHIVNYFEVDWESQRDLLKDLGKLIGETTKVEFRLGDDGRMEIEDDPMEVGSGIEGECQVFLFVEDKEAVHWREVYSGKYEGDFVNDSVEWESGLDHDASFDEIDEQRSLRLILDGIMKAPKKFSGLRKGDYQGSCSLKEPWVYGDWDYSPLEGRQDGLWAVSIAEPFEIFFAYYNSEDSARAALDYINRFVPSIRRSEWIRFVIKALVEDPGIPRFEIDEDFSYFDDEGITLESDDWELVSRERYVPEYGWMELEVD